MQNENQTSFTAIVREASTEKIGEISWTVLKASPLYGDRTNDKPIRIVLHDISTARKGTALVSGDIIMVWGKLGYYTDYGLTLYADSFVILSKVKKETPAEQRMLSCLAYSDIPHNTFLVGVINNVADDKIILKVKRTGLVRGEMKGHDILPIKVQHPSKFKNLDPVAFTGFIQDGELVGEVINLAAK